jgi:hypothetical protein
MRTAKVWLAAIFLIFLLSSSCLSFQKVPYPEKQKKEIVLIYSDKKPINYQ